jgi:phage shock protein E
MKRAKIKNKILITLVLAVVMSGNAYSVMIDVRTDEEWRAGYIEGAIHIPLSEIKKNIENYEISKDEEILLYCRSGNRSGRAKVILDELGYTDVTNIGGIASVSEQYNLKIKTDSYAPNWELYAETDVGIKYYMDTKSYFERNGNKYVITMQDTSAQGTDFKSLSMYFEIDCGKVRARPVRIFGYSGLMGDGEEVELSEKSDNVWMYATAGTPNGVLLDVICVAEDE